eukprot:TRINITY_DN26893_c0_g1_i1.p1 TRINITY_DN26893_c0_g1~~TRINITY_DN26893_c0_g1_i1.p1  ORF type:complete len:178 (-),score=38.95 TRINITY_DN26893_c0_g1_i1:1004-1537(-)
MASPDYAAIAASFEQLAREFAKLNTGKRNSVVADTSPLDGGENSDISLVVANETLRAILKAQISQEKVMEQKLSSLTSAVERLEENLPKQIAVEYAQVSGRMHNMAQSDAANGRLLPLPNERGTLPQEFPKTATTFALVEDSEILKLLVHYGLSTDGDRMERRANLATHCGVRIPSL